jgi:hypothetical protein
LSDLVVDAGFADHGDEDVVCLAGGFDLFFGDFAEDTDGDAGAWVC